MLQIATNMDILGRTPSYSGNHSPLAEIIDSLRDDSATLNGWSQTCLSLLPSCRKYIFQSIILQPCSQEAKLWGLACYVTLFGNLLDSNSQIAGYIQNLMYQMETANFKDKSVPRILDKPEIQHFVLTGAGSQYVDWSTLHPDLWKSLLRIIHSAKYFVLKLCQSTYSLLVSTSSISG